MRPVATIAAMPGVAEPADGANDGRRELEVVGQDRPVDVHRDGPHRGWVEIRWQASLTAPSSGRRSRPRRRRRRRRRSPFGIPGRPSMIARRTSSRVGRTSARFGSVGIRRGLAGRDRVARGAVLLEQRTPAPVPAVAAASAGRSQRERRGESGDRGGAHPPSVSFECDGRRRQAPVRPDPERVPGRGAAVRRHRRAARDGRGRGDRARPAPARRADHPPGLGDLRHAQARIPLDAGRRPRAAPSEPTRPPR